MIPIIDSGHGQETPGKESVFHCDSVGRVLLKENSVNEAVANKLSLLYWMNKKPAHFITNEWYDVNLGERTVREQKLASNDTMFISIHADAFGMKNKARGGRFFYHSESGKKIADGLTNYFRANGYGLGLREPKQANFYVLKYTKSPAVLFEMGFMTTESDLKVMLTDEFRNKTALLLYNGINQL